ncbi:hypothetical protein AABM36_02030 [Kocuria sp. KSNUG]|uniref:hypothetical protein n=1 Tax=Kocuria sp. KSNUG TaxID=3136676 RepID=UPI003C2CFA64
MDSHATWPAPVTVNDRGFDAAALRQLRRTPSSSDRDATEGAGAPSDAMAEMKDGTAPGSVDAAQSTAPSGAVAAEGTGATSSNTEAAPDGAGDGAPAARKPPVGERLVASLLLVIPLVSALVIVLSGMRFADTRNGLWLGVIAVVLVAAALSWVAVLRRSFTKAQGHLAARLPGVIGYGVGIIRELDVESPFDENGVSDTVTAHLTVRVNPTQGPAFTGTLDAVYAVADAEKLEVGSHGLVRYLRSDPENTVSIETRLPAEKVQQIYRAAAMN